MNKTWKQERPDWCPHLDCLFLRRAMDNICGGRLPQPESHNEDFNTHRFCLVDVLPEDEIFDLQINKTDIGWFEFIFQAIKNDCNDNTN